MSEDEDYATIEIAIKDSGAVTVNENGMTPTDFTSIDEALEYVKFRMMSIRGDMHFETEHDPNEGP